MMETDANYVMFEDSTASSVIELKKKLFCFYEF